MPVCTSCRNGRAVERLREECRRLKEWESHLADLCEDCRRSETERIGEALEKLGMERDALSAICTKCKGACDNFGGDVHIDAAKDPSLVLRHADVDRIADARAATASRVNIDDPKVLEAVLRVVAELGNVTDAQAPVIIRKLRGQANVEIAYGMGLSEQCIWKRWNDLKIKNPIWAALENGLQGKRFGGRKPGQHCDGNKASSHLHGDQHGEAVAEDMQSPES